MAERVRPPESADERATLTGMLDFLRDTVVHKVSGLTDEQARTLLQQEGYTGISNLRAEPNSIWVWQADAMKDGRRVRLGVDYRGKLLELSGGSRPCTSLGGGAGSGFVGAPGARLSEASGCSGR